MEKLKQIFKGYVKNRTQEVALAVIFLALFFWARNFKIQFTPYYNADLLSSVFVNTAASLFSWPYSVLFPLATLYGTSNPLGFLGWFAGTQVTFFLAKLVGKKWAQYTPGIGEIAGWVGYGLILQIFGMIDVRTYLIATAIPGELYQIPVVFIGAPIIWKLLRRLGVID